MSSNGWIKKWIKMKIKYYKTYLKENQDSPLKEEVKESIRILKELVL